MKLAKGWGSGALALSLSALMVKILGVLYKVPLSYILGDEGMGYFNSAYSVYGLFYILSSAGIPKAIAMLTARSGNDPCALPPRELYAKSLKLFFALGAATTAIFILMARPLSGLIGNSKSFATMLAIAPSILFTTVSGVARGYLNGKERLMPIAVSQMIEAFAKLVLGIAFAYVGVKLSMSLSLISAFTVLGITLGALFSCLYLYITAYYVKRSENTGQKIQISTNKLIGDIFKIALPITISSSVMALTNIIDLGVTMRGLVHLGYTESEASALYGNYSTLAVPMFNLIVSVLTPISVAVLPKLVRADSERRMEEFNSVLKNAFSITAFIAAPCAYIFLLYPFDILDILYSSQSSVIGAPQLSLLAPSVIVVPLLTIVNTALEATGRVRYSVISMILGALVKIIVSYLMIEVLGIGISCAPIGTVVSYVVSFAISTCLMKRLNKGAVIEGEAIRHAVTAAIAFGVVFIGIYARGMLGSGEIATIICIIISTLLYCIMEFSTIFSKLLPSKTVKVYKK